MKLTLKEWMKNNGYTSLSHLLDAEDLFCINPPDMSKEAFLDKFGVRKEVHELKITEDMLPVVWVDSGYFTAAGIAINQRELARFTGPDTRARKYFMVERSVLAPFLPDEELL